MLLRPRARTTAVSLLSPHRYDLHGVRAAFNSIEIALGENDEIVFLDMTAGEQRIENVLVQASRIALVNLKFYRVDAAVQCYAARGRLMRCQCIDRDIGANTGHPACRRPR